MRRPAHHIKATFTFSLYRDLRASVLRAQVSFFVFVSTWQENQARYSFKLLKVSNL